MKNMTFKSMKTWFDLNSTQTAFDALERSSNGSVPDENLKAFIVNYFDSAGTDLVYYESVDFVPQPDGFLPKVENVEDPDSGKFTIGIPIGLSGTPPKFRGLLASKMYDTAKGIVINLISMIDDFGHVLNGARAYYTNQSQPLLLSSMVYEIYLRTGDLEFVSNALPALIKEYKFWNSGFHLITIRNAPGGHENHSLSRYYAMWNEPRPESSLLDEKLASKFVNNYEKQHLYWELASAVESGIRQTYQHWLQLQCCLLISMYSYSRWNFTFPILQELCEITIASSTVDVYSLIQMELDISNFARAVGDYCRAEHFFEASLVRKKTINSIFWNSEKGQWLDNGSYKGAHTWDA
ncbi:unnamed protein product [Citrullus colocynthis]|uniref:Trehalase n=1 Tax=Citrullus colocynthis TaxID=252529 RepID=A0ABP0XVZ6_9ROSI